MSRGDDAIDMMVKEKFDAFVGALFTRHSNGLVENTVKADESNPRSQPVLNHLNNDLQVEIYDTMDNMMAWFRKAMRKTESQSVDSQISKIKNQS